MTFAYSFMTRELEWRPVRTSQRHPDARAGGRGQAPRQACIHCCFDASALWNPPASHNYRDCLRRGEPRNGGTKRYRYYLQCGDARVRVCVKFWLNTFGIGRDTKRRMQALCAAGVLPVTAFSWGGLIATGKKRLVLEYIDTVPRHYSHYRCPFFLCVYRFLVTLPSFHHAVPYFPSFLVVPLPSFHYHHKHELY